MAMKLEILLQAVDRLSAPLRLVQDRISSLAGASAAVGRAAGFDRLGASIARVGAAASQVAGNLTRLGAIGTGVGVGGIALFNAQFLRGARDMERYRIMLRLTEGSAEAAERTLGRLRDWADRTPFSDADAVQGFLGLRDLNIDGFASGALNVIGDAAAGRMRTLGEALGAFQAAMRGEFDPLEAFGVRGRVDGENIIIDFVDRAGRELRAVVDKNNRKEVQRFLLAALNARYQGSMEALSQSWDGMVSNLDASWRRFTSMVMDAGVFDWLKQRLERILGITTQMQSDGSMQTWANATAAAMLRAFEATERFLFGHEQDMPDWMGGTERMPGLFERLSRIGERVSGVFERMRAALRPFLGDLGNLEIALVALGAVTFAPLATALAAFGVALATTPAGAAVLALTALGAAGLAIRENWLGIGDWFAAQMRAIEDAIKGPADAIGRFLGLQRQLPGAGGGDAPRLQPNGGGRMLRQMSFGEPLGALSGGAPGGTAAGTEAHMNGMIEVRVSDERVRVTARSRTPGVALSVNQGVTLGAI